MSIQIIHKDHEQSEIYSDLEIESPFRLELLKKAIGVLPSFAGVVSWLVERVQLSCQKDFSIEMEVQ